MLWEGELLRNITENQIQQIVAAGLEEHLQLEYKSALYDNNHAGQRESLLDVCMFANTEGGLLVIGVSELRDGQGQPTGVPDPQAPLGVELANPEAALLALDARVTSCIDERLPLEMAAVPVRNGTAHVLLIRVPNSTSKPHCVRHQGHIYFPARRERHRYDMDVRELKELVMRTASRLEQSESFLADRLKEVHGVDPLPYLFVAIVPVFTNEFLIDIKKARVQQALGLFQVGPANPQYRETQYSFWGLERRTNGDRIAQLARNGLIRFRMPIPLIRNAGNKADRFFVHGIDFLLRSFMLRARTVYEDAEIAGPFLLNLKIDTHRNLVGVSVVAGAEEDSAPLQAGDYLFPPLLVDNLANLESAIRPLCDHVHQTFGGRSSPMYDRDGNWAGG